MWNSETCIYVDLESEKARMGVAEGDVKAASSFKLGHSDLWGRKSYS